MTNDKPALYIALFYFIVEKEFLIFLFFLIVSGTFWLLMALNETVEREFEVPVSLVGVPKDVVITTDIQDTLKVTLREPYSPNRPMPPAPEVPKPYETFDPACSYGRKEA